MLTFVLPKGRIAEEAVPLLRQIGLVPEDDFFNAQSRALKFKTSDPNIELIRVRAFDAATYLAYGVAQWGIVGSDVLEEHDYNGLYTPIDLKIGACRLSVAAKLGADFKDLQGSVTIASKYPNLTRKYFAARGIQAECVKLSGALELAPQLGLCDYIVDLVSSGATLKANELEELDVILPVSSRLVINRVAYKTHRDELAPYIQKLKSLVS